MDKMDANHDKVITKDELTDWIQLSYMCVEHSKTTGFMGVVGKLKMVKFFLVVLESIT